MSISPSISLKGEKEFRQAISQINLEMKTLGSEMIKVKSEFDGQANSTEALTARNKVLAEQVDKQKEKVSALKDALASASETYGENDKRTLKWQQSLNYAEADLNKLNKEVKDNEDKMNAAQGSTDEMSKGLKDLGSSAQDAEKKTSVLGDVIKGKLIADAIIAGVKGLANAMKSVAVGVKDMAVESARYADNVITMAENTGIAQDKLQELIYSAELVDVSVDTITSTMARNIRSMNSAQVETSKQAEAYSKLGVQLKDANGEMRDSEQIYWNVIDALGEVGNETERDMIAMELFGRSAQSLNSLINAGSETMQGYADEAHAMGFVLSGEVLDSLGAFDDGMQRMDRAMEATKYNIGAIMAPALADLAETTAAEMGAFSKAIQNAGGDVGQVGKIIGDTLNGVLQKITESLPGMVDGAVEFMGAFLDGILSQLPAIMDAAVLLLMTLVEKVIEMLPTLVETGVTVLLSLVNGIADALPKLIPTMIEAIGVIVKTLIDNLPALITAALKMILALAMGLVDALPELIAMVPEIIEAIVNSLMTMLPEIIEAGIIITIELSKGLIKAIPQLVKMLPQIVTAIIDGIASAWPAMKSIGGDLISGLWEGIKNAMSWLWDKVVDFGQTVTSWFTDVFKIGSPSKVFEDEIGVNLGLGIGSGFSKIMDTVKKDMASEIPTSFDLNMDSQPSGSVVHLHIGTLIADSYGLKELERKLSTIRLQERVRVGG